MKAEITFEKPLAESNEAIKSTSLEILLGDVYKGQKGDNGTSAYQSAVNGGFKGTEEQFNKMLASTITFEVTGTIN